MRSLLTKKKGQLDLGSAPMIVLIVGLTFLIMATMAFIGQKYGEAIPSSNTNTTVNESITITTAGVSVSNKDACNYDDLSMTLVTNATYYVLDSGNYTLTASTIANATDATPYGTSWLISYTNSYAGVACEVTGDLETEISNNTSIAGIVLTISLVGIVLAILISVFLSMRRPRI